MIGASMDLSKLNKVFGSLKARANDHRDPLREIGLLALKQFDHRFEVSGPGWAPNKAGTKTLVKTGRLRDSFVNPSSPKNLFTVGRMEATFGSKLFYAAILQKGGVLKSKAPKLGAFQKLAGLRRLPATFTVLPARPIVVPPNSDFTQKIGRVEFNHFKAGIAEGLR